MEASPHNLHLDLNDNNQTQVNSGDKEMLIEPQRTQDNDVSPSTSKFENVSLSTPSDDGMTVGTPTMVSTRKIDYLLYPLSRDFVGFGISRLFELFSSNWKFLHA